MLRKSLAVFLAVIVYIGGGAWDHPEDQQVTIDLTKLRKID